MTDRLPRRVRLTLEFDGAGFRGWQQQPEGERTVQATLRDALATLPGDHGPPAAAGRTDAGVHALALTVHVDTDTPIPDAKLRLALQARLPRDVAVLACRTAEPTFEAQYGCHYRRYLYRARCVRDTAKRAALDRGRVWAVHEPWDVDAMRAACMSLRGRHDFSSFATQETRSRERTVHLCEVEEAFGEVRFHVAADGFLRGMVRALVGTLAAVGAGRLAPEAVAEVLAARDRRRAGKNVPPYGLYFVEAGYAPWDRARSDAHVAALLDLPG